MTEYDEVEDDGSYEGVNDVEYEETDSGCEPEEDYDEDESDMTESRVPTTEDVQTTYVSSTAHNAYSEIFDGTFYDGDHEYMEFHQCTMLTDFGPVKAGAVYDRIRVTHGKFDEKGPVIEFAVDDVALGDAVVHTVP